MTDNLLGNPQVSCTPHSGSVFPIGKTTVTCKSSDTCGNRSECSFTVTVIPDVEIPGTDTNGDGLSDIWQAHFNAHGLAPNADTDGDGMTNAEEARAGTNPRDPGSSLRIDTIEPLATGEATFKEFTITKKTDTDATKLFQLQFTANLGTPWADLGLPKRGSGVSVEFRIRLDDTNLPLTISTQAFFRLVTVARWLEGDGVDIARCSKVAAHFKAMQARPAVQRVLAAYAV